jgi:hypothetical protein
MLLFDPMLSGSSGPVVVGIVLWFMLALAVGAAGALTNARPPAPQALILGLTAAVLLLSWTWPPLRRWVLSVDIRALVAVHVSRVVPGIAFLVFYGRGELPYDFAVPGGWGDIVVGVAALAVCVFARPDRAAGRAAIVAWNIVGLVDILFVVATATRLGLVDPQSMRALLRLPLSLLPTFLVPIVIATHVMIFARLRGGAR